MMKHIRFSFLLSRSAWMPGKSSSYACLRERPHPLETDRLCLRCVSVPMENSSYHKQELALPAKSATAYAYKYTHTHAHIEDPLLLTNPSRTENGFS